MLTEILLIVVGLLFSLVVYVLSFFLGIVTMGAAPGSWVRWIQVAFFGGLAVAGFGLVKLLMGIF
jgi:hypothetical protein